jgi:hypothetical protein
MSVTTDEENERGTKKIMTNNELVQAIDIAAKAERKVRDLASLIDIYPEDEEEFRPSAAKVTKIIADLEAAIAAWVSAQDQAVELGMSSDVSAAKFLQAANPQRYLYQIASVKAIYHM